MDYSQPVTHAPAFAHHTFALRTYRLPFRSGL
jgi:hypothetical protein